MMKRIGALVSIVGVLGLTMLVVSSLKPIDVGERSDGHVPIAEGPGWSVVAYESDGRTCVDIVRRKGEDIACGVVDDSLPLNVLVSRVAGEPGVLVGIVSGDVERVTMDDEGDVALTDSPAFPAGYRLFAAPVGDEPVTVSALDDAGRSLGSHVVSTSRE